MGRKGEVGEVISRPLGLYEASHAMVRDGGGGGLQSCTIPAEHLDCRGGWVFRGFIERDRIGAQTPPGPCPLIKTREGRGGQGGG